MDKTVTLRLNADAAGMAAGAAAARREIQSLGQTAGEAGSTAATGMGRAEDATNRASRAATLGAQAYDRLKQAVYGYASLRIGQQIIAEADAYTNLNSKLRLVTQGEEALISVRERLFSLAQSTRSDFGATAELYARLTQSTAQLGLAESQRLSIVQTINQAMIVSGATVQESTAAIIQLSQGLASGTLRGEEFNSVAEQAPILLDMVAKSLGVTRGELRAMASDGKITADVLTGALLEGAGDVQAKFEQMAPTVSGAAVQVRNAWTRAVGELFGDSNTALAEFLAGFAEGLAQLPETLRAVFTAGFGWVERLYIDSAESLELLYLDANEVWIGIQRGVVELVGAMRLAWASGMDYMQQSTAGFYAWVSDAASSLGLDEVAISARNVRVEFEDAANAEGQVRAEMDATAEAFERRLQVLRDTAAATIGQAQADRQASLDASDLGSASKAAGAAAEKAGAGFRRGGESAEDLAKRSKKAATELLAFRREAEAMRLQAAELAAELAGPAAQAEAKYQAAVAEANAALFAGTRTIEEHMSYLDDLLSLRNRDVAAIQEETEAQRRRNEESEREKNIVGNMLVEIEDQIRLIWMSAEARQAELAVMEAQQRAQRVGRELTAEEIEQIREKIKEMQQAERAAEFDFAASLSNAVNTAMKTGSLSEGFRQFARDFQSAIEGGLESAMGAVNSALQFADPVVNAYRNSNGNSTGSALREINRQLAASGNVFAQAAAAIDSIFGGRLFGTDYQVERQGYNVNFGPGGFSGSQFTQEARQRSFFRGTRRRTTTEDLDAGTESALEEFFERILDVMHAGARDLGTEVPEMISGAFQQVTDANGKIIDQFGIVMGRRFEETFEEFQQRLLAENILAVIDTMFRRPAGSNLPPVDESGILPGVPVPGPPRDGLLKSVEAYEGEASAIAERWRADAETLLDGAQFLLAAAIDIQNGVGLLAGEGGLTAIADLMDDLQQPGESLQETYTRVAAATRLLEQATALMGISLDGGREAFVRAASEIAEAAGGIDRAQQLWNTYFETFYSDSERAALTLERAEADRATRLQALGLSATTTAEQFRAAFEAAFPSLSAEERVQWLEAGESIRRASDAQAEYNSTLSESEAAAEAAREAVASLLDNLTDFAAGLDQQFTDLARSDLSDFQREMLEIDDGLRDNITRLQAWRAEMVRNGASAADLARVDALLGRAHELAAAQAARAIQMLREAGRSLVQQLMGGSGGDATVTDAAQGMAAAGVGAFEQIGEAAADMASRQLSALQRIREWLDAQLLGDLTSLTPGQQYAEAQSQFAEALAAAQSGDPEAMGRVTQIADTLLRLGRERFAGGGEYLTLEATVRAAMQGLLNLPIQNGGQQQGGGYSGGGYGLEQSTAEFGQQASENRIELARQISEIVRDLLQATGDSLSDVAESLGLNLTELVGALGVNLGDLSVSTATSLATIANSLGVELSDLAAQVGIDLGSLADAQSLMNDAVESAINGLPDDQRDRLRPLLDAVEQAAAVGGPELVEDAIKALEAETRRIGGAAALALAPYLAGINPTNPLIEIDSILRSGFAESVALLSAIEQAIRLIVQPDYNIDPTDPDGVTGGDPGGGKSVAVITPGPVPVSILVVDQRQRQTESELLAELKAMRAELADLRRQVAASGDKTAQATRDAGTQQARATEQQTRELTSRGRMVMS